MILKRKKAFTFTEIVVVMVVLGIVMAVAAHNYTVYREQAKDTAAKRAMESLVVAIVEDDINNPGIPLCSGDGTFSKQNQDSVKNATSGVNLRLKKIYETANIDWRVLDSGGSTESSYRFLYRQGDPKGDPRALWIIKTLPDGSEDVGCGNKMHFSFSSGKPVFKNSGGNYHEPNTFHFFSHVEMKH